MNANEETRTMIAAMAMQGLLAGNPGRASIVRDAVEYADALLAELERTSETATPVCEHEFISIVNPVIKSGEMCIKCGKLRH